MSASRGGVVRVFMVNSGVWLSLNKLTIADGNAGEGGGGGIYNNYGTLSVSNSTFSGNQATTYAGGGIYNIGTLTVSNSTFSGNSATGSYGYGGGISNEGVLTVSNSTFSGNSAGQGGGINNNGGTLTVINSTFAGNSAGFGAGGINNLGGTATLKNTIVANNPGGNCYNYYGTITDGGHNLSYPDNGTCPGIIHGDPRLGPLQANGGPTQMMALGPGSAARDAGDAAICAAPPVNGLDQRGVPPGRQAVTSGRMRRYRRFICRSSGGSGRRSRPGPNVRTHLTDGLATS